MNQGTPAPVVRFPADLPDLRLWLTDQWKPGRPYHRVAALRFEERSPHAGQSPEAYARWEHDALTNATLWWVGADMVDLLLATAAAVPDDVLVSELEKPAHTGLVVFEKPWLGHDSETSESSVEVNALLWSGATLPPVVREHRGAGVPCLSLSSYRRLNFTDGLSPHELELAGALGAMEHGRRVRVGTWAQQNGTMGIDLGTTAAAEQLKRTIVEKRLTPAPLSKFLPGDTAYSVVGETWVPLGRSDWPLEDRIDTSPWPMPDAAVASFVEDRKVIAALWTLLHTQGTTSRVEQGVPRQAARRSERAGIAPDVAKRVQVVTLRKLRREPADDEHQGDGHKVEHDHRWMVSGHYRWQPYGKGREQRRLIFIAPFIKGPDDKPLKVRDRVNAFIR